VNEGSYASVCAHAGGWLATPRPWPEPAGSAMRGEERSAVYVVCDWANYCWFSDPRKALCLKLAGTPDATEPLIGMCDSARCPQATHHAQHRHVWANHAAATKVA
jgi:hypothetical protein